MAEDDVNLVGTLEKIVYSNPENGFLIGTFLTENSTRPMPVNGLGFNMVSAWAPLGEVGPCADTWSNAYQMNEM
jgi:hypothetical protein